MKFNQFYDTIKNIGLLNPQKHQMDNWTIDVWTTPAGFFANMSDGGYCRSVGKFNDDGSVKWIVNDNYPRPLEFEGITESEFNELI